MCGIVVLVGSEEAAPLLLEGLRQLEYRDYDSAGITTVKAEQQLSCPAARHLDRSVPPGAGIALHLATPCPGLCSTLKARNPC